MINKKFILLLFLFLLTGCSSKKILEYTNNFNFFDSDISIRIYTTSSDKANKVFNQIQSIYSKYEKITDRHNLDSEISYIYRNNLKDEKIKLSNEMADLIEYGINLYKDSNGILSINTGNIVDKWDELYSNKEIPDNISYDTSLKNITIKNNLLTNNHLNLNFDNFIKGYTNNKVKEYLKSVNIDKYFINTGNEIIIGKGLNNKDYVVAISSPFDNSALKVFNLQNKYLVTKSIYYNAYKYDDVIYSNIVDAKNETMSRKMISVTVVGDDIYQTELAANMLFINNYYKGIDIAKKYNVDVIWCYKDNNGIEIIKDNFD